MADETQRIQVVIFDNDSVVTLAEFEQMHPADVEWRGGQHANREWSRKMCDDEGIDLSYLEDAQKPLRFLFRGILL